MKSAVFEFDDDLRSLLWCGPATTLHLTFRGPQTIKHLVETLGIPHTEVGPVKANGATQGLDYQVQNGDVLEIGSVPPLQKPDSDRFVLDGHLGRLAAYLRLLGLDCLYRSDGTDEELARLSVDENRYLLTRDRRLLMRKIIVRGGLIRSLEPNQQLLQVWQRYALSEIISPFRRCIRCNGVLQAVDKRSVIDRLEPLTRKYYEEFRMCPLCKQVYWKGSHFERMLKILESLGIDAVHTSH